MKTVIGSALGIVFGVSFLRVLVNRVRRLRHRDQ